MTFFSPEIIAAAEAIALPNLTNRQRVRGITICSPNNFVVENAFWLDQAHGKIIVSISAADIGVIPINSPLDLEMQERLFPRYPAYGHPDDILPRIILDKFSLLSNRVCPTLTVFVELDKNNLDIIKIDIARTALMSQRKYPYAEVGHQLRGAGSFLQDWAGIAAGLYKKRMRGQGKDRAKNFSEIDLSQILAEEFLYLANDAVCLKMSDLGIPVLPSSQQLILAEGGESKRQRRPYERLFTSPLRRFSSVVTHRQITAHLNNVPSPYSADDLSALAKRMRAADSQERNRREKERVLTALRGRIDRFGPSVILDAKPGDVGLLIGNILGTEQVSSSILEALVKRLQKGEVRPKDLGRILFLSPLNSESWDRLRSEALDYLKRNSGLFGGMIRNLRKDGIPIDVDMFNFSGQEENYSLRIRQRIDEYWLYSSSITKPAALPHAADLALIAFITDRLNGGLVRAAATLAEGGGDVQALDAADDPLDSLMRLAFKSGWQASFRTRAQLEGPDTEATLKIWMDGAEEALVAISTVGADPDQARRNAARCAIEQWKAARNPEIQ